MQRKVRSDSKGLFVYIGGWILRPPYPTTNAIEGSTVEVAPSCDPIQSRFGTIKFPNGHTEKWSIYNSENIESK